MVQLNTSMTKSAGGSDFLLHFNILHMTILTLETRKIALFS